MLEYPEETIRCYNEIKCKISKKFERTLRIAPKSEVDYEQQQFEDNIAEREFELMIGTVKDLEF